MNELGTINTNNNRISYTQIAALIFIITTTFKVCLYPSLSSFFGGYAAFYITLIMLTIDCVTLIAAFSISKKGGVQNLHIPQALKKIISAVTYAICVVKAAAYSFEYCYFVSGTMFENINTIVILSFIIVGVIMLASKGYIGISRTALIVGWLLVFALIYNLAFGRLNGNAVNLLPMINGRGDLTMLFRSAFWFGDGFLLIFADASGEKEGKPTKKIRLLVVVIILSVLSVLAFMASYFYVFGNLSRVVDNAFYRLLSQSERASIIGVVDWPIMLIWISFALLYISLFFACSERNLSLLFRVKKQEKRKKFGLTIITAVIVTALFLTVFENRYNYVKFTTSYAVSAVIGVLEYGVVAAAFIASAIGGKKSE